MAKSAEELMRAAGGASLVTKKEGKSEPKTNRVGLNGVTPEMRKFIKDEMYSNNASYIMQALMKQLKADGFEEYLKKHK